MSAKRYVSRAPATKSSAKVTQPRTMVVPKSGSQSKSAPKRPSITRCGRKPTEKMRMRSCFFDSDRASHSTSEIFAISLGWKISGPSFIQRRAPPAAWPRPGACKRARSASEMTTNGTARTSSLIAELHRDEERGEAGDGADGLPLEEPEAVAQARAGIDGRGAVDHDHAEGEQEQHGAEQHRVIAKHGLGGAATGYAGSGGGARGHESLRTNCLNCSPRASKLSN